MKKALILHGMPSRENYFSKNSPSQSNSHWIPWLQRELIHAGVLAQALELPDPYRPVYEKWREVFEWFPVDEETTLIGHSCGGGFLLRWLTENKIKVNKIVLVAPWVDREKELQNGFFDFEIDPELASRCRDMAVFYSSDDSKDILNSRDYLKEIFPEVKLFEFEDKGHFTEPDMGSKEFPELRDFVLGS